MALTMEALYGTALRKEVWWKCQMRQFLGLPGDLDPTLEASASDEARGSIDAGPDDDAVMGFFPEEVDPRTHFYL